MSDAEDKIARMTWSPLAGLSQPKRNQFRFTEDGNQYSLYYYSDNGVNMSKLLEHAFFFADAAQSLPAAITDVIKAQQFGTMLQAPANAVFATVLRDQLTAGVNDLSDILKAYIHERLGEHGQRAAYRQLEGLRACKKNKKITCFEWETSFATANNMVEYLPGPEPALTDDTLRRAYLDSFPRLPKEVDRKIRAN